jgi:hypothetical protein
MPIETVPSALPPRPTEVKPVAPERYKIQFTVSRETHDKLRRAQDLLRHTVPNGDPAIIFERALTLLVADLERTRLGKTAHPRAARNLKPDSRHVPAAVNGPCGSATTDGAPSMVRTGGTPRPVSSSITMWCRLRPAARRRRAISSCGAGYADIGIMPSPQSI